MPKVQNKADLLKAAMVLPEHDRAAFAYELLETLSSEPPGLSLDDPEFERELERRSGDWDGAVPMDKVW